MDRAAKVKAEKPSSAPAEESEAPAAKPPASPGGEPQSSRAALEAAAGTSSTSVTLSADELADTSLLAYEAAFLPSLPKSKLGGDIFEEVARSKKRTDDAETRRRLETMMNRDRLRNQQCFAVQVRNHFTCFSVCHIKVKTVELHIERET